MTSLSMFNVLNTRSGLHLPWSRSGTQESPHHRLLTSPGLASRPISAKVLANSGADVRVISKRAPCWGQRVERHELPEAQWPPDLHIHRSVREAGGGGWETVSVRPTDSSSATKIKGCVCLDILTA
ncbi:hypothetical protein SKAU_G00161720 [Synaphobranchus kaupii]|uniref:Uncharacterized protein n=1 Tax=Synaphobranchus kaupii TaxID=118154 RepID=A0A9Q1FIM3_SYNKA|nr:hypothetical protein SKAU_G00161720 [Synaphobranchus kaupii]